LPASDYTHDSPSSILTRAALAAARHSIAILGSVAASVVVIAAGFDRPRMPRRSRLPSGLEPVSGVERAVVRLAAGQRARLSFDVRCPGRGEFEIGDVFVRVWGRGET
jgi:hypothetical protein